MRRVVAAFHQHVRANLGQQRLRRVLGERHHPVHRRETFQDAHAALQRIDRAPRALQAPRRIVVVDGHDEAVAEFPRLVQIAHMAGVQNVEAAVGEHDALAVPAGAGNGGGELVARQRIRTVAALRLVAYGAIELGAGDGGGAELGAHQAAGHVRGEGALGLRPA